MDKSLMRKKDEIESEYIKRIVYGKLIDKTIKDNYEDLSELVFGEGNCYNESEVRKRFYGIKRLLEVLDEEEKDKLSTNKLNEIKKVIGELDIKKREVQLKTNEMNKVKRELIKSVAISEDIKEYLNKNNTINIPEYCYEPIINMSNYKMIVHITDFHIGSIIKNCKGNNFNWNIANQRINKLIDECIRYRTMYNINKIYVVNTGDTIEHISMRKNQNQYCEFNQSEQINKSIQLIYRFLTALCKKCNVEYDSIPGNHDRLNGDSSANYDGDSADTIIHEQIKEYCKLSKNKRLFINNNNYCDKEIIKNINGVKCKFIHGDIQKSKNAKALLKNEISMDNNFYDILFKGHLHNFSMISENNGRYIVNTGCLSGFNNYSKRFGCATQASQTICILKKDNIELIKDVKL